MTWVYVPMGFYMLFTGVYYWFVNLHKLSLKLYRNLPTLKKKIELSNFLEQIETNRNSETLINKLDLMHSNPKAHVIGITGSPGVGKSSLIDKLIQFIRKNNKSVGVIAVDPSSRETGGAILGCLLYTSPSPRDLH